MVEKVKEQTVYEKLYEEVYEIMNLRVGSNSLGSWAELNEVAGKKDRKWVYERYIPRLKKTYPSSYENVNKSMEYQKQLGIIQSNQPGMKSILDKDLNPQMLQKMFNEEVQQQLKGNVSQKVKAMLDSMENDLVIARGITLQACMVAITGYLASVQQRVKEGKEIYTKEFKAAYEIYKTEMGEPTKIKETRTKNMQVTLHVPISQADVKQILGINNRQDLSIEVADVYKNKLDDKFNLNQHTVNDELGRDSEQTGNNRAVTETEEVPDAPTI